MRLVKFVAVVALGLAAVGQTTAPATQKTMHANTDVIKADKAAHSITNPQFEGYLAKFPAKLLAISQDTNAMIQRGKDIRAWDAANVDGKEIAVTAVYSGGQDATFYVPGTKIQQVKVRALGTGVFNGLVVGDSISITGKIGKGGIGGGETVWPDGEVLDQYVLVIEGAKTTKAPAAASQPNQPG